MEQPANKPILITCQAPVCAHLDLRPEHSPLRAKPPSSPGFGRLSGREVLAETRFGASPHNPRVRDCRP
ncbi:MAG TPA: hypothetical protein PKJ97_00300 [Candidatus Bilamarchaeaceae archaeon]|nr:hypothetical protein [Candidatus Bilamarchaeaceae archaeon]